MAGPAYVKKRLWNPEVVVDANNVLPNNMVMDLDGSKAMKYILDWTGASQAAYEEFGTAGDSEKNGTTTPFQITVVSSSASDKRATAAGMVHSVALIGVSVTDPNIYTAWLTDPTNTEYAGGRPKASVEVVAMNGTSDVLSTRYYLWVDHAYACEWGTGATHDAEGNITIESPANTTLLTILATYNESNGGTWHFPDGFAVTTTKVKIEPTATLAAGDGTAVSLTWVGHDHTLNDSSNNDIDYYTYIHYGGGVYHHTHHAPPRYMTKTGSVEMGGADTANTPVLQIRVMLEAKRYKYKS